MQVSSLASICCQAPQDLESVTRAPKQEISLHHPTTPQQVQKAVSDQKAQKKEKRPPKNPRQKKRTPTMLLNPVYDKCITGVGPPVRSCGVVVGVCRHLSVDRHSSQTGAAASGMTGAAASGMTGAAASGMHCHPNQHPTPLHGCRNSPRPVANPAVVDTLQECRRSEGSLCPALLSLTG